MADADQQGDLIISSPAFENNGDIPSKYTCDGEGINPPIKVDNIPDGTQAMAIIAEDPDTSKGTFDHWIVWNIPPTSTIEENRIPGISGKNGTGKNGLSWPLPSIRVTSLLFLCFCIG